MEKIKMEKGRLALMVVVVIALAFTMLLYAKAVSDNGGSIMGTGLISVIAFAIVGIFIIFFSRQMKSFKEGMPMEDERSKKVQEKAGSKTFMVGLYILLGIGMFEEHIADIFGQEQLEAGSATGFAIVLMAVTFMAFWAYYSLKGVE